MDDKKFFESKKFLALMVVLSVVLILGIFAIIYHAQIESIITSIVTFASSHQLAQGAQDAIAKWKGPAQQAAQEVKQFVAPAESAVVAEVESLSLDPKDIDPEAFA